MQPIFLIIVILLIALAILDLVVGVSNDAVNFLVSAIGSKVAPFRVIMIIAGVGILFGATFSNGMMDIARKGIFQPQLFSFRDIMFIFLAVMLTDIVLLDLFNTIGLPTSTTVSVVFELLGSAVAMAVWIKLHDHTCQVSQYINSASALRIIGGIFLSVAIAFTLGSIVQYLSRLLFSFNYRKTYKKFGAVWGGIALTAITYFILIKGLKGTGFAGKGTPIYTYVQEHTWQILLYALGTCTLLMFLFQFVWKINIFKITVLVGTFALALAFAGNDLVNFIGVPLAGLASYNDWVSAGTPEQNSYLMESLAGKVSTPEYLLLIAGIIMFITLWFSKKARSVTKTELNLSRQDEGYERFPSNAVARALVRVSISASKGVSFLLPKSFKKFQEKRFNTSEMLIDKENGQTFDLIRATVNLMVSGILISVGTSEGLPLSTTYVTFMVSMGSSLADNAWGRESAVYRVAGVLSVIGGWLITALVAFTISFTFVFIMNLGGYYAIPILILLIVFFIYRSQISHKKRMEKEKVKEATIKAKVSDIQSENVEEIKKTLEILIKIYDNLFKYFRKEKRSKLKKMRKLTNELSKDSKELKLSLRTSINDLHGDIIKSAPAYVQSIDLIRDIANSLRFVVDPVFKHIDNNHKPFIDIQFEELDNVTDRIKKLVKTIEDIMEQKDFDDLSGLSAQQNELIEILDEFKINQIKRIKDNLLGTRNSVLYLNILQETRSTVLSVVSLLKAHIAFCDYENTHSGTLKR